MPHSNGWIGTTTGACSSPSAASRPLRRKPPTTLSLRSCRWPYRIQANQPPKNSARFTLAIESDIRGLLRNFGLKVGVVGTVGFDRRIHELVEGMPDLAEIMQPLLDARKVLREHSASLHRKLLLIARTTSVGAS